MLHCLKDNSAKCIYFPMKISLDINYWFKIKRTTKQKLLTNLEGVGIRSKASLSCKAWFLNLVSICAGNTYVIVMIFAI